MVSNQIGMQPKIGLTFGSAKTVLRQDPDVVMVGEIRDEDTASNYKCYDRSPASTIHGGGYGLSNVDRE